MGGDSAIGEPGERVANKDQGVREQNRRASETQIEEIEDLHLVLGERTTFGQGQRCLMVQGREIKKFEAEPRLTHGTTNIENRKSDYNFRLPGRRFRLKTETKKH